jgi:DNA adenine methylase
VNKYPRAVRAKAPPLKSQGIKTKIVPFILRSFSWDNKGIWVEPFIGSGAVAFNAAPARVLAADTNRHVIRFYQAVKDGEISPASARAFLVAEGAKLFKVGEDHYYEIRDRFNAKGNPLDLLFLSRACFNGMMRFNGKGGYNVPFCRKPDRFRPAYVTKIANQIEWIARVIRQGDWTFVAQDWRATLGSLTATDFAYLDPPYIGRHTDYYNSWNEDEADALAKMLRELPCGFAYSMWSSNKYRTNEHLPRWFSDYPIALTSHFYHVGPTEDLRNEVEEALVVSPRSAIATSEVKRPKAQQLGLTL